MSLDLLGLLYFIVQVWPSSSQFVFEVELVSVDVNIDDCDTNWYPITDPRRRCEPAFSIFCLREGRDTQSNNTMVGGCPLGSNDERVIAYTGDINFLDGANSRPGLPGGLAVTRSIMSQRPWPIRRDIMITILIILFIDCRGHFNCMVLARLHRPTLAHMSAQ